MLIQTGRCRPCEAAKLAAAQKGRPDEAAGPAPLSLPDFGLLGPLKRSPQYAAIRRRVAEPLPVDAWQLDMRHYFVFSLRPDETAPNEGAAYAIFAMQWEDDEPLTAAIVNALR